MGNEVVAFCREIYLVDEERTCPPAHLARRERQLGVTLPAVLRELFLQTSLRGSEVIHLHVLDGVALREGVLVFAYDQHSCWSYGVRREDLGDEDPAVVADKHGTFVDEGVRLSELIRAFAALNRVYEAPCLAQTWFDRERLVAPWQRLVFGWDQLASHELWTNGEAVFDAEATALGARDEAALERAARALGALGDDQSIAGHDEFIH